MVYKGYSPQYRVPQKTLAMLASMTAACAQIPRAMFSVSDNIKKATKAG